MRTSKRSGLLITESARDFSRVHKELYDEIQPTGAIERMHVDDIAWLTFEIQRLRRSGPSCGIPLFLRPWKIS